MGAFEAAKPELTASPRQWLVTGSAGFIGSHLVDALLSLGQKVAGLDDLSSGTRIRPGVTGDFIFIEGDIRDPQTCAKACAGVDIILHHAAIASVVKSLEDPALVRDVNSAGFETILSAAAKAGAARVVYASSSAVYGDGQGADLRRETDALAPESPYAETKCDNERAAAELGRRLGLETVGLRYFNAYGPGQDPNGAYAAVIAKWLAAMSDGKLVEIFGDGKTVRDFCYIDDVVQANILAALTPQSGPAVYNIGSGTGTSLNELFDVLSALTGYKRAPVYRDFRAADIRISCADIAKAENELGYKCAFTLEEGLARVVEWARKAA